MIYEVQKGTLKKRINIQELEFKINKKRWGKAGGKVASSKDAEGEGGKHLWLQAKSPALSDFLLSIKKYIC